jgi:hypothetical protein
MGLYSGALFRPRPKFFRNKQSSLFVRNVSDAYMKQQFYNFSTLSAALSCQANINLVKICYKTFFVVTDTVAK